MKLYLRVLLAIAAALFASPAQSAPSAPWSLVGTTGSNGWEIKSLVQSGTGGATPPDCKLLFCPGGQMPSTPSAKFIGKFWMGETEVTGTLWSAVYSWATANGYHFQNPGASQVDSLHPVSSVSWRDAFVWCNALSEMSGLTPVYTDNAGQIIRDSRDGNGPTCDTALNNIAANGFRLPSEWEWQCAARWQGADSSGGANRAGGTYWTSISSPSGSHGETNDFALYSVNGGTLKHAAAVKSKLPNYLGIYDMNGNVAEWCFGTISANALIRSLCGGTYYQLTDYAGSGIRYGFFPSSIGYGLGFRLAMSQTSRGDDYVVSNNLVTAPTPSPARIYTTPRCSTRVDYENQKDSLLEQPDSFPYCRANLGGLVVIGEESGYYGSEDILGSDEALKLKMIKDLFHSDTELFSVEATGRGDIGMTPNFWANTIKDAQSAESDGRNVFGFWVFREDAFLFGQYDATGNFDPSYYGAYLPAFPDVDPRIPGPLEMQGWRNALAASNLKCKGSVKLILLMLEGTMHKLLNPDPVNGGIQTGGHLWNRTVTPARAAEVLAFIRDNFDGISEENHIGHLAPNDMAEYAKWSKDNGKAAFFFLGGADVFSTGLDFAQSDDENLFTDLQAAGVQPNDPNNIFFRQGGFQGIQQVPEDPHNSNSTTVFSEVAWLDKRLRGPMITSAPSINASAGQLWTYQPVSKTFGSTNFTWSLSNQPSGMTVDPASGLVQWTPPSANCYSGPVNLTVSDGAVQDTQTFEVTTPILFNLGAAVLTGSTAVVTMTNQLISGVPCTVTLTMTGYSSANNSAPLGKGAGSTAGSLVVSDGSSTALDAGEGINFDIQVSGSLANVRWDATAFTIKGSLSSSRDYSLSDTPGTTSGAQGAILASQTGFTGASGVNVPVSMDSQFVQDGFDFAFNRRGTGPIMGLETISIVFSAPIAPVISSGSSLQDGAVGASYSQALAATGGVLPYFWEISSGNLPPGLSLSGNGIISGTPSVAGTSSFGVTLTGGDSGQATASFALAIAAQPPIPTITTTNPLPTGAVGLAYSQALAGAGVVLPCTWSIASGFLPPGLSLGSDGTISGIPTAAVSASFTVMLTGADGVNGSKNFSLGISPPPPTITTASPLIAGTASSSYSQALAATGGVAPYTWSVSSGSLPAGLSLGKSSGTISGTPISAGVASFTVAVTGNDGSSSTKDFTISTNSGPLNFQTTSPLPKGAVNMPYVLQMVASGGVPPITWSIASGNLPAGLSISPGGLISGTSTSQVTNQLCQYRITGSDGASTIKNYTLTINANPLTPAITTGTLLATGTVGQGYLQNLGVNSGIAPYSWSLVSGILPNGLSLSPGGILSGIPSSSGTASFTLEATGNDSGSTSKSFTLPIVSVIPSIDNASPLPAGAVGVIYSQWLTATGGAVPYTWTISAGSLPLGLSLDPTGAIAGSPAASGTANFSVVVTANDGLSSTKNFSLAINPGNAPAISSANPLPQGMVGTPYNQALAATGGATPYLWLLSSGSLPNGLALNASGAITGTATLSGTANFTVQVTGSDGAHSAKAFSLTTVPAQVAPSITTGSALFAGRVGVNYSQALSATGGVAPYAWALLSGSLPGGLSLSATGAIAGTPNTSGTAIFNLKVTGSDGAFASKAFTLAVNAPAIPTIVTLSPLYPGRVGATYNRTLIATGGLAPYSWVCSSGTLPAGLSLSATGGTITGTCNAPGTSNFTVTVSGSDGLSSSKAVSLTTYPASQLLIASVSPLASGTFGVAYTQALLATGGVTPYSWAVSSGALPAGLSLSATAGVISGTSSSSGVASFDIAVTGSDGAVATKTFSLTIYPVPVAPTITTFSPLSSGTAGIAYSQALAATGGTPPYAWSIASGSLPSGLSLSATGAIAGIPSASGTASVTLQVAGGDGLSSTQNFSLVIFPAPILTVPTLTIQAASGGAMLLSASNLSINATNVLQTGTNLISGTWIDLYTVTGTTSTSWNIPTNGQPRAFYRIQSH